MIFFCLVLLLHEYYLLVLHAKSGQNLRYFCYSEDFKKLCKIVHFNVFVPFEAVVLIYGFLHFVEPETLLIIQKIVSFPKQNSKQPEAKSFMLSKKNYHHVPGFV